jgi:hypothetical protein
MLTEIGYIDAGTGSYLLTAIAGGLATMWFFLRSKIDRLLGRTSKTPEANVEDTPAAEQADGQISSAAPAETTTLKHE